MLGETYIDRSLASGTQLLNIHDLEWEDKLLEIAGIDQDKLPTLVQETEIIGELPKKIAKYVGLKKGIPIIPGASDGALNNIGLGAINDRVAAVNIGTSGALRILTDKPFLDSHKDVRFFCYYSSLNKWLPGGATNNAGIILRWFKDHFEQQEIEPNKKRGVNAYERSINKTATIKPGAEGLLMLPFLGGERFPIRDPKASGVLLGLTLSHGKVHITKAILEGIVFTFRWIMETLEKHGAKIEEVRVGGGGARSKVWRQIQADILGKTLIYMKVEESSALGAAVLSAISLGIYKNLEEAKQNMIKISGKHYPNLKNHRRYLQIFKTYKSLYQASKKFFK
jgi:gluconokinase